MKDSNILGVADADAKAWRADVPLELSHITALLDAGGHVTLGKIEPFDGVAIAARGAQVLATLQRQEGERAEALLHRVEQALHRRVVDGEVTHEIDVSQLGLSQARVRRRG